MITFKDRSVRFERPFSLNPGAKASPSASIRYRVIPGGPGTINDEQCRIVKGRLHLDDSPRLTAACLIEASIPATASRPAAEPRRALITVGFAQFQVSASDVEVSWSETGPTLPVVVREDSGDAYGIFVGVSGESTSYACEVREAEPTYPSPAGTREYRVVVSLADPGDQPYTCTMLAQAAPQDIAGGDPDDEFTITVRP